MDFVVEAVNLDRVVQTSDIVVVVVAVGDSFVVVDSVVVVVDDLTVDLVVVVVVAVVVVVDPAWQTVGQSLEWAVESCTGRRSVTG